MRTRGWLVGLLTVVAFGLAVSAAPAPASAQPRELTAKQRADKEKREKKALTDFSAGKYQEAIDLMAELYADFQEPMYYRNIGRCYQKLGDPDRAIAAFEEFVAKAKDAPPASIAETKELIKQMQELKQKRAAEHTVAQPPPPPPPLTSTQPNVTPATGPTQPLTTTGPLPPPRDPGPAVNVVETPAPPPRSSGGGGHTAAWVLLGGGAALAAAGGVVLATSFSEFNNAKDNKKCPDGMPSECAAAADTVKSRNLISKILFVGGALAAVAGGVALVVSPGSSNESASALPNELTVALRGRF
jgi:hypothetical protein